jgi:hypothetical protein
VEIKLKLLSFGIPMDHFPIDDDSKLVPGLTDFCERRRSIDHDRRIQQASRILAPGKSDILLGRGKPMQNWCGNLQLATILLDNADRRNTEMSRRGAKNDLSHDIVKSVKEYGGRFLKREKGALEWFEVDDIIAREKVNNGFRNQRQSSLTKASNTSGETRNDRSGIFGNRVPTEECIVAVEALLSVVSRPTIQHAGCKRPRTMLDPHPT